MKKVALILSGCGVFDGAEIHESTLAALALTKLGAQVVYFAPDAPQHHVTDHVTHKLQSQSRSALVEAARIARGNITPLEKFEARSVDAILLPGGMGAVSTLCNYIEKQHEATVNPSVSKALKEVYSLRKPIGATCIAPLVLALTFSQIVSLKLTLGMDDNELRQLKKLGMDACSCDVHSIIVDESHKIVTTPAYMDANATIADIWVGIEKLCLKLVTL